MGVEVDFHFVILDEIHPQDSIDAVREGPGGLREVHREDLGRQGVAVKTPDKVVCGIGGFLSAHDVDGAFRAARKVHPFGDLRVDQAVRGSRVHQKNQGSRQRRGGDLHKHRIVAIQGNAIHRAGERGLDLQAAVGNVDGENLVTQKIASQQAVHGTPAAQSHVGYIGPDGRWFQGKTATRCAKPEDGLGRCIAQPAG